MDSCFSLVLSKYLIAYPDKNKAMFGSFLLSLIYIAADCKLKLKKGQTTNLGSCRLKEMPKNDNSKTKILYLACQ